MSNVHELPQATLENVATVLRKIADEIDAGDLGKIKMAALVMEDSNNEISAYGLGGADFYRAIALFSLGVEYLTDMRRNSHE